MPMQSKEQNNEDSESEWDSMPEPPRATNDEEFHPIHENGNDINNGANLKKISKSSRDSSVEKSAIIKSHLSGEDPPHSFKTEVKSPSRYVESPRPGKTRKGQSYEPLVNGYSKKPTTTTFPDVEVLTTSSSEEGADIPVYSKIKKSPNSRILLQPMSQKSSVEKKRLRDIGQARLSAEKLLRSQHVRGQDNDGYESDEEILFDKSSRKSNGIVDNGYQESSIKNNQGRLSETQRLSISQDQKIYDNDDLISDINKKLEKCFTWVSLPFACIFLFLHHLLKFLLIIFVKPIFIDTLSIVSTYFLKPLHNNVLNPIFKNIHMATLSMSNIFANILRPLVSLFKSCRLVEINHFSNDRHRDRHII